MALDVERDAGRALFTHADGSTVHVDCAGWRADTLAGDLRLRDFTINALAIDLSQPHAEIVDVTGGLQDLARRLVRVASDRALPDDPLRGLRAVRLLAELAPWGFRLDGDTAQALRQYAALLAAPAAERVRDELVRILNSAHPDAWLRLMFELGQLRVVLPETAALAGVGQSAPHHWDVFEHTLAVMRHVAWQQRWLGGTVEPENWHEHAVEDALLPLRPALASHFEQGDGIVRNRGQMWPWAAMSHDWGKPATRSEEHLAGQAARVRFLGHERVSAELVTEALRRLRFNDAEVRRVAVIVAEHLRPAELATAANPPSRRAVYRFFRDAGDAGVDVALLSLADVWAIHGPDLQPALWAGQVATVRRLLQDFFLRRHEAVTPLPLLNGKDLMQAFDLPSGRLIGRLLAEIAEAQASGEVTTHEEAVALASRIVGNLAGSDPKASPNA
jgi:tRNA nucleotidyltransferase/poly(A) polymerase